MFVQILAIAAVLIFFILQISHTHHYPDNFRPFNFSGLEDLSLFFSSLIKSSSSDSVLLIDEVSEKGADIYISKNFIICAVKGRTFFTAFLGGTIQFVF